MTIKETKNILDDCLIYRNKIDSLKLEVDSTTSEFLKSKIKDEINELTQKVMDIRCKIDSLDGKHVKLVMRYRYVNGLSFKDIAEKLGVSYQWINKVYNKGLEQMSKML